ncbi:hypothetical protein EMPG_10240 [Blastomyces silverae]|uniref:Uncharacterized protein n=1 Tax=Blastomyces silverae TaxID=2060906 RepID=A0A0H1B5V1_9EURO|nr:hypothetical protein EMPG_10240 [Blastomyces silverae]
MASSICYAASKAALENLTRSLEWELGRSLDATVNAVILSRLQQDCNRNVSTALAEVVAERTCGWYNTTTSDVDLPEVEEYVKKQTPAGHRIAMVDDVLTE